MPRIRWATADDARGVAIVHVASWRAAYRGLIDQSVLDALSVEERAVGWARWIEDTRSSPASSAPAPRPPRADRPTRAGHPR